MCLLCAGLVIQTQSDSAPAAAARVDIRATRRPSATRAGSVCLYLQAALKCIQSSVLASFATAPFTPATQGRPSASASPPPSPATSTPQGPCRVLWSPARLADSGSASALAGSPVHNLTPSSTVGPSPRRPLRCDQEQPTGRRSSQKTLRVPAFSALRSLAWESTPSVHSWQWPGLAAK